MMQVILTELEHDRNERVEKTGREWMMLLVRLCKETSERMIEAVKEFLAPEGSRANYKIKIKIRMQIS
ncbi:hypothetical protein E2C01_020507 [Portunus trituberculatus]|uniref:Uncharacterized protein n=1 Tax=Portunus trituberculatus TaxID=210409 RepID=A0A5B7E0N0_PORTR|nr:hypothetical protein [Portunus trituberculatus]